MTDPKIRFCNAVILRSVDRTGRIHFSWACAGCWNCGMLAACRPSNLPHARVTKRPLTLRERIQIAYASGLPLPR